MEVVAGCNLSAYAKYLPLNIILAFYEVITISGIFLVRYRSKKTHVNLKVTLAETLSIVIVATIVSLLLAQYSNLC